MTDEGEPLLMRFVFGRAVARGVAQTAEEPAAVTSPASRVALFVLAAGAPHVALAVAARLS